MRVTLPHDLGREEVRRRLNARSHEIGDMIPGGLAQVTSNWPTDDLMELTIYALGQTITGDIEIYETQVVIAFDLPPTLSFLRPMIEGAVRSNATRLLGKS
ncbi:MAG: hypothetical protein C0510_09490 [Erythrobacter sp.]|nr:hypothetical protein [Erythrobacter sp.]